MAPIDAVKVAVFDAYGTLFDWASAAERARDALGDRWQAFADLWRQKQLQYTWLRSLMGRHADFFQVTSESLDFTLRSFRLDDSHLRARLLGLYRTVGAYPDARSALESLRALGLPRAILSNGEPEMLAAAADHSGLTPLLDAILSVESAGIYKPHPSVYALATAHFGAAPAEVLFVSSNGWDAVGAKAFGMRVAWCNRSGQPPEAIPYAPDAEIRTLAEVPGLVG